MFLIFWFQYVCLLFSFSFHYILIAERVRNIRYPGDIRTPHLSTPRRARSSVNLLKETIAKQQREKKLLSQKLRRAEKTIQNLNGLIAHLKQSNLISEGLNAHLHVSTFHFIAQ